ncbi:ABC transporter permease [Gordonia neofelifaecis]|uniref:Transport permease protein n=1 Tax=Gordonia neofelifaecis NRRL B-59395 TaxID=644548 RepID=F1YE26_9ACTN|nr:ABC transporter permease [Gordonia neofelifaecis]EGD57116.1 ABC-2 type transporter [Gordonia neofelifaecis NRRL B-59395]
MTTTLTPLATREAISIEQVRTKAKHTISLAETVGQSFALARRSVIKMMRNPEQFFDVVLQPIVFTLMFTYIFGGAVSGDTQSYLPVIIPGILVQTVIVTSIVTGTQLREDMNKGVFDRFRSLPIARISPLAGALLADVVRYLIATVITFTVGIAMGWRPDPVGVLGSTLLVLVCSFAVSWIFALMGCLVKKASAVQGVSMLIMFPLTFMSNAFVPVETMPGWLQSFVNVNPISHLVTAVREMCNDGHVGTHVLWSLVGAAVITAVFAPLAVRAYVRNAR